MCISTIRALRPIGEAPIKEFLKEYFRLVGCLFTDKPIQSTTELNDILSEKESAELNLVLNISKDAVDFARCDYILDEYDQHRDVNVEVSLAKKPEEKAMSKEGEYTLFLEYKKPLKYQKKFYYNLICSIVDAIWKTKPLECQDLKIIASYYLRYDMFGYAQNKRAFRIFRMGEILDIVGMKRIYIPYSDNSQEPGDSYIRKMLECFHQFYCVMDSGEGLELKKHSIYWRYARVNAARKIKEILDILEIDWERMGLEDRAYFTELREYSDTFNLLNDLKAMDAEKPKFLGTLFLAARLCQCDRHYEVEAAYYYKWMLERIPEEISSVYAFAYYECGRYLESQRGRGESASETELYYYRQASENDQLNYHSLFKLGQHFSRIGEWSKARMYFAEVQGIIMQKYYGNSDQEEIGKFPVAYGWQNISLKGIQYLFKAAVGECKEFLEQEFLPGAWNCIEKLEVYYQAYKDNSCVRSIYGDSSRQSREIKSYHEQSIGVKLFDYALEIMKLQSGYQKG